MSDGDRGKAVRVNGGESWDWQAEWRSDRGVPLFGIFLIALGAFLLVGQFVTLVQVATSAFFLAVGLVLLGVWVRDRRHGALYLGTIITALAAASLLSNLGIVHGSGWGTFFLGLGFLAIAAIRAAGGSGWGWQAVVGGLLTFFGGTDALGSLLNVDFDRLTGPILIVLIGILLIARAGNRGTRRA